MDLFNQIFFSNPAYGRHQISWPVWIVAQGFFSAGVNKGADSIFSLFFRPPLPASAAAVAAKEAFFLSKGVRLKQWKEPY